MSIAFRLLSAYCLPTLPNLFGVQELLIYTINCEITVLFIFMNGLCGVFFKCCVDVKLSWVKRLIVCNFLTMGCVYVALDCSALVRKGEFRLCFIPVEMINMSRPKIKLVGKKYRKKERERKK